MNNGRPGVVGGPSGVYRKLHPAPANVIQNDFNPAAAAAATTVKISSAAAGQDLSAGVTGSDGSTWSIIPPPPPQQQNVAQHSIVAASASHAWATLEGSVSGGPSTLSAPTAVAAALQQATEPIVIAPVASQASLRPQTSMGTASVSGGGEPTLRQNSADLMLSSASPSVIQQPKPIRPAVSSYSGPPPPSALPTPSVSSAFSNTQLVSIPMTSTVRPQSIRLVTAAPASNTVIGAAAAAAQDNLFPVRFAPGPPQAPPPGATAGLRSNGASNTQTDNVAISIATILQPSSSTGLMTNCQILTEDVISLPPLGTPKMSLITLEPERENEGGRGDVVGPAPQASNQNTFKPATHAIATMDHSSAHQTATAVIEEVKILPNKSQVGGSGEIIPSAGGLIQSVNILPNNNKIHTQGPTSGGTLMCQSVNLVAENQPPNMIKYLPPPEQAQPAPKMIQSVNIESVNIVPPPESHPPQKMSLISLQPAEPTNSQINAQNNASSFSIQPSDKPITIEPASAVIEEVKMKILPPPHNKGQQTATGSGEIISSTGGLIQSVNILPETGKPTELHKVPGSVVTSSVRILPLSAPATSAADAGNTVALISAEGPPKPLVSSQAATFTTRPATAAVVLQQNIPVSSAPSFVTLQPAVTDVVESEEVVHLLPAGPPQPAKINHINLINPGDNIVQISQQPQPQTYTAEPRPPAKKRILTSTSDGGNVGLLASLDLSSAPAGGVSFLREIQSPSSNGAEGPGGPNPLEDIDTSLLHTKRKKPGTPPGHSNRGLETDEQCDSEGDNAAFWKNVDVFTCYKCRHCGYLGVSRRDAKEHLEEEHEDLVPASAIGDPDADPSNWLQVAKKQKIPIQCPSCPNTFMAERSFKVHMTDDHSISEQEVEVVASNCQQSRKEITLRHIKAKQEELKAKRADSRRKKRGSNLEVYINENGEMRLRSQKQKKDSDPRASSESADNSSSAPLKNKIPSKPGSKRIDVSVDDFVRSVESESAKDRAETTNISSSDESERIVEDSEVVEVADDEEEEEEEDEAVDLTVSKPNTPEKRVIEGKSTDKKRQIRCRGRPKGARTTGLGKIKRLKGGLERMGVRVPADEQLVGVSCEIGTCGVRFKKGENLVLHRSCHSSGDPDTFYCPRCPRDTSPAFSSWKAAALHLWKEHRLDMELYSCDLCLDFRSYTLSRLQEHKAWHRVDRPFLCNKCGKSFKTGTQLKVHATRHKTDEPPLDEPLSTTTTNVFHSAESPPREASTQKPPSALPQTCDICHKVFNCKKLLRFHKERFHEQKRPHLCNFCGYSASSASNLALHTRNHTGEKRFRCTDCDFKTGDHNTFRRHRMRHTGERQYKCPYCDYQAIQASTYKAHLKKKHAPQDVEKVLFSCKNCRFDTFDHGKFTSHVSSCPGVISKAATSRQSHPVTKIERGEADHVPLPAALRTQPSYKERVAMAKLPP